MNISKIIVGLAAACLVVLTVMSPQSFYIFWLITGVVAFAISPVVLGVYIAKKTRYKKIGKVFSVFCFTVILVISGSLIALQMFIMTTSVKGEKRSKEFAEYEKPYVDCINAYNSSKTTEEFDVNVFSGLFERENNHGFIVLQMNENGEARMLSEYFHGLKEYWGIMAKKPGDIKYVIVIGNQMSEYYGKYTDGSKAYRNMVPIKLYGLDTNDLMDSVELHGDVPVEEKSYDRRNRSGAYISTMDVVDEVKLLVEKLK